MGKSSGKSKAAKPKPKAAPAPPAPLKAQGTTTKRTPISAFDGAAGKDVYEPEKVLAERLAKGVTQYLVKWVGYESKDNTWEPIEHLASCEDMIADMKDREKTKAAQLEAAAQEKQIEKEAAAAAAAAAAAESAAAARVAARAAADATGGDAAAAATAADASSANALVVKNSGAGAKRSSWAWAAFSDVGCEPGKACCQLMKLDGNICGEAISAVAGPTGLKNHIMYKHPDTYIKMAPPTDKLNVQLDPQTKMLALPAKQRDEIHLAHARWLCKRKRPLSLPEDEEYHDIWNVAMKGAYTPPDHKQIMAGVLALSAQGKAKLFDVNSSLRKAGIKPAMAGDIWSDRGVSLLGLCEYYMSDDWTIEELVLAATPFSERHTGEAIDLKTRDACVAAGLTHDVYSSVFFPVSDNASNMVSGWAGFGRGPCCVHTGQLSVHVYLNHPRIKPTREKEHGIAGHFSHSTGIDGLGALNKCQRECNLPVHHPVKDNDTRWSSGHDQMEWFRVGQRAIQLYDVNHARKAGDAYKQYQMGLDDWTVNTQSVAVLQPIADWTQLMQGTKTYPTLPLVLPTVYALIDGMQAAQPLVLNFQGQTKYELEPKEMHDGVLEARTDMCDDWVARWITNLAPEVKRVYAIAALLHPCFKTYDFIDDIDIIPQADKAWALRELRTEWATVWKPKREAATTSDSAAPAAGDAAPADAPAAATTTAADSPVEQPKKMRKVSLGGLLASRVKKEATPATKPELDELEEYLAEAEETDLDLKVLAWWKAKETKWPNLAKMVKQYFAAPASSAGVERVFSAAGKMHGDLQKSAKDSTLEHSLFAAWNTD